MKFEHVVGAMSVAVAILIALLVVSVSRTVIAVDCKRDGFVWIDGAKYECKQVKP